MKGQTNILRYIIGTYLVLGGGYFLYLLLNEFGFLGFLNSFFPAVITSLILIFFIVSGFVFSFRMYGKIGYLFVRISLWLQAIQVMLLGIVFKNSFGPYFGIGFTDTPDLKFVFSTNIFTYKFENGFDKVSDEISIVFNLIAIFLLVLINFIQKEESLNESEITSLDIES